MTKTNSQNKKSRSSDEIDFWQLLIICITNKWKIIGITALVTLFGYFQVWRATPEYRADALLHVEQRGSNLSNIETLFTLQEASGSTTESEILRSRMILGQAAQQAGLDLVVRPNYFPVIGEAMVRHGISRPFFAEGSSEIWSGDEIEVGELLVDEELLDQPLIVKISEDSQSYILLDDEGNLLGESSVGQRLIRERPFVDLLVDFISAPVGSEFAVVKRSESTMIRSLQSRFTVMQRGRDTGILELSLVGPDPSELERSLNAIANVYLTQNINRQAAEAESRLEFLEQQTPQIQDSLNSAENRLNEYRASQDSVDLNFETRSMLERLVELEGSLNGLEIQETEIAQRFTRSHPDYQALLTKRSQLEREKLRLESLVNELPETQRQVLRLNRDVEVSQQIYMQMLNATQELRIARAGTIGNVRILDEALVSPSPITPRTNLILVISVTVGLILSLLVVFFRSMINRGVSAVEELQELGLQVYATVPLSERQPHSNHIGTRRSIQNGFSRYLNSFWINKVRKGRMQNREATASILALTDPSDLTIEALRNLRTSLHFALLESKNNRLMLTGPSPSVGKSFISTNLAVICAQSSQKVLLIDCDMRKGRVHQGFGDGNVGGLSEFLAGKAALDEIIRVTSQENLSYIARGVVPPNPSELLMVSKFEELLSKADQLFDLVIIDTPPVLAVTDAAIIGKYVAATLLITRFQESNTKEIERSIQQLESAGVTVTGSILNAISRRSSSYGYGYGYGYYNYNYGYGSDND